MQLKISCPAVCPKHLLSCLVALFFAGCSVKASVSPEPLNIGQELSVFVDGIQSKAISPLAAQPISIFSQSTVSEFWQIESPVSGNPKIRYLANTQKIGPVQEAMLTIQGIDPKINSLPVPYYSNLSRPSPQFQPGFITPITYIQNADDDDYLKSFPPGKYLFSLYVYGDNGWDKQNIIVTVQ